MDLFLKGTLTVCIPKTFTDKDTGKEVLYYQSGFVTKDGFATMGSRDLREYQNKSGVWKIQATKADKAPNAFKLKAIEFVSGEDGEDTIL